MVSILGTNGNNTLHGTNAKDFIYGYAGNDDLYGNGGNAQWCRKLKERIFAPRMRPDKLKIMPSNHVNS